MFYVNKDFTLTIPFADGNKVTTSLSAPDKKPNLKTIYASTGACVQIFTQSLSKDNTNGYQFKILDQKNKQQIYNLPNFPIPLSNFDGTLEEKDFSYSDPINYKKIPSTPFVPLESLLEPIAEQDEIKVLVMNGMGTGLGDGIIGFAALNVFYNRLKKLYKKVTIDLGHTSIIGTKSHQMLYSQESIVNRVLYLPITIEALCQYDAVVDNSAMIIRENFSDRPIVDFYLENMGIDPASVTDKEKRAYIKLSRSSQKSLEITEKVLRQYKDNKLIMVHTSASTPLRSMPKKYIGKVINELLHADKNNVVVTYDDFSDIKGNINLTLGKNKHRHINLHFKSGDFNTYAYMIGMMDALVTIDTSAYHIADSFDIPTAVIFSTINPELRLRYYPYAKAVQLATDNKLMGIHVSDKKEHMDYIDGLWSKLDTKLIVKALANAEKAKITTSNAFAEKTICPLCASTNIDRPVDKHGEFNMYECSNCELQYATNREPANYDEMYEGEYDHYLASNESAEQIIESTLRQIRFEPVVDFLKSQPGTGKFLDYGCANGAIAAYAKSLGFDAYGIDISKHAIEFAKSKFGFGNKVQLAKNISSTSGLPHKFDYITSFEVVEHLPDPNTFAKEVFDNLKPGGYWLFSTPNRKRVQFEGGNLNSKKHTGLEGGDHPPEHLQRFTEKAHRTLAATAGFELFHQCTSKLHPDVMESISGAIPNISVNVESEDKKIIIDSNEIKGFTNNYVTPFLNSIDGYGNFLLTICRKPI